MEIPIGLKQVAAFTKRDFHRWTTYKTAMITGLINVVIGVFSWGIRATYLKKPVQEMYGTDYVSFLVVGVCVSNLIMPLVRGVERQLNPWTLETILMTDISTPVFVIGNVMWSYVFSIITFVPYILIGIHVFHARLNLNIASAIVAFAVSAAILMGLAMVSTGLRIVIKTQDPVTWALDVLENLFAGQAFPVTYLDTIFFPGASTISWFLPQTWVLHLCRLSMLTNPSLLNPAIQIQFLAGTVFAVILFPVGYKIFRWGVARSKKEGTLGWY